MKKLALILAAAVGISMAGPALNSWVPSGTSNARLAHHRDAGSPDHYVLEPAK